MTISFNDISPSYRASKNFIEMAGVKKSLASLFIPPTGLIIGMYDPLKTATVDYVPVKVTSADHMAELAGFGSHAHRQALKFPPAVFLQGGGVYWIPIPEEAGGDAADETVTFTGTATSSGTIYIMIAGDQIEVPVVSGDSATDVGDALVTAITAEAKLPVSAANAVGVVTLTAKFKGTPGNQILVVVNPEGESQEDKNPAGITTALENSDGYLDAGATDPDIEDAFFLSGVDILGDRWYTVITMPFVDSTTIGYYQDLGDQRADPAVNRIFGAYMGYTKETYAAALALPATVNKEWIGQLWENRYRCPDFELSAELCGIILDEQAKAPNRPYKTVELSGAFDGDTANRRYVENDALFRAGIGYCNVIGSQIQLGDIPLTYRTNGQGGDATDWYDAVSLHRRQAKAYSIEQLFLTDKYARGVVVDNDAVTKVDFTVAPKDVISDLTKLITDLWGPYGWSKNTDTIIENLTAEINSGYESRIDAQITDDEAQALRQIALKYAFYY